MTFSSGGKVSVTLTKATVLGAANMSMVQVICNPTRTGLGAHSLSMVSGGGATCAWTSDGSGAKRSKLPATAKASKRPSQGCVILASILTWRLYSHSQARQVKYAATSSSAIPSRRSATTR